MAVRPQCLRCRSPAALSSHVPFKCGHWMCRNCGPPQTCPEDGRPCQQFVGEIETQVTQVLADFMRVEEEQKDQLLLKAQNEYLRNAVKTAFLLTREKPDMLPLPVPVPSAVLPPLVPLVSYKCPVCLEFPTLDWNSLQLHLEQRHIVPRPMVRPRLPQRNYQLSDLSLTQLHPSPNYSLIQREIYQLLDEAQKRVAGERLQAEGEKQGVWRKLLEVLVVDCEFVEFGLAAVGCPSPAFELAYILRINLIEVAFPGYFEQFLCLSEEEQGRFLPFAQRMVLDKVHSALQSCGFSLSSTGNITSPAFTFSKSQLKLTFCVADSAAQALSELFSVYLQVDRTGMAAIVYALQHWAGKRGLGETLKGEICVIMVIAYMQKEEMLPVLQPKVGYSRSNYPNIPQETNLAAETRLFELFRYYALHFDWQKDCISILTRDKLPKQQKGWQNSHIALENPLNCQANLTSDLSKEDSKALIDEFRLAFQLLAQGNGFLAVCSHSR